jgi:hypothetical protein
VSSGRSTFAIAVTAGIAVVAIPYLWVLCDLWHPGGPTALRRVVPSNFFDLQARAMFHGHLSVPNGSLGIEGFLHDGHEFAYFGIFPSLLRMPLLLVTSQFDGRLTAPSMLLAWLVTGLFSGLLLWRVRVMVTGDAPLGRAEAASYGIFATALSGGSVLIYLAATPFVYNEDFAWSVAITVAALFALLGVLEQPTWRRVLLAGVFVLAANLGRTPTGYACVIGAGLVAAQFALGRRGPENRRWTWPMVAVAVVGFAGNATITYLKFGMPIGLPMADQVWAHVNAHRRQFLAANGGRAFSPGFLPSTVVAYLQPLGIRMTGVFPFVATPAAPAASYAGAVLDQTYPTASIPSTMPMLFLLACWGVVAAFRRRPAGQLAATRGLLVAAAAGTAGVLLWGFIAERYTADFMPFLILAGAIGLVDVWRRLHGRSPGTRGLALGALGLLAGFSIFANIAIAVEPSPQSTEPQLTSYLNLEKTLTPGALGSSVHRGATLPYWAPKGELYIVGNCSGLYYSTGQTYKSVPGQQLMHWTWDPVEQQPGVVNDLRVTVQSQKWADGPPVPLFKFGRAVLYLQGPEDNVQVRLVHSGADSSPFPSRVATLGRLDPGQAYDFEIWADPNTNALQVSVDGRKVLGHFVAGPGPGVVVTSPALPAGAGVRVDDTTRPNGDSTNLCRSLLHGA